MTDARRQRAQVCVSGRVQNVFYRATCARRAEDLLLGGFVRNLPDGRVEAVFEGDRRAIDEMITWCRRGPERARVDSVEVVWQEPRGEDRFRAL